LQLDCPALEIIVVDNGSNDGSAEFITNYLATHKPSGKATVQLLKLKANRGWTGGVIAAYSQPQTKLKILELTHSNIMSKAVSSRQLSVSWSDTGL
jgi:glycosyltransferase involved in cell wall biosynthesis